MEGLFIFYDIYRYMKIIIREYHSSVIRRYEQVKGLFHDYLLSHNVLPYDSFDGYFSELCWDIATQLFDRSKMDHDEYVTLRNQMIRFINNNFYEEFKEYCEKYGNPTH
jgi:hypothetical protein